MVEADHCEHRSEDIEWYHIRKRDVDPPQAYGVCRECESDMVGAIRDIKAISQEKKAEQLFEAEAPN